MSEKVFGRVFRIMKLHPRGVGLIARERGLERHDFKLVRESTSGPKTVDDLPTGRYDKKEFRGWISLDLNEALVIQIGFAGATVPDFKRGRDKAGYLQWKTHLNFPGGVVRPWTVLARVEVEVVVPIKTRGVKKENLQARIDAARGEFLRVWTDDRERLIGEAIDKFADDLFEMIRIHNEKAERYLRDGIVTLNGYNTNALDLEVEKAGGDSATVLKEWKEALAGVEEQIEKLKEESRALRRDIHVMRRRALIATIANDEMRERAAKWHTEDPEGEAMPVSVLDLS